MSDSNEVSDSSELETSIESSDTTSSHTEESVTTPQTIESQEIPPSVPNDDLPRSDDDRPMREPTPKQNKILALGIALVLLAVFIGGWLYRDEIFDFLKGLVTGRKKKDLDKNERDKLK